MGRVARFLSISGHEFPLPTPGVLHILGQRRGQRARQDDLLLEVSLHDQYGVLDDGSIDDADLRHDGTDRDVIGYLCDNCYQSFTEWAEALAHVGGSSQEGRS